MHPKFWPAAGCLLLASHAWAAQSNYVEPPEWVEEATPAAPAFSKDKLIPIDMPHHVSVKVGVDPDTITVGGDGVVRYVLVMTNATGTVNAVFEGIRCTTDEVKTYARLGSTGDWRPVTEPKWQAVTDNFPSKHAYAFARQGGCEDHMWTSKAQIIQALKQKSKPIPGGGRNAY